MRELFAQQLRVNSQETAARVIEQLSNRSVLRRHVGALFADEGGLSGFTAWATDVARDLAPKGQDDARPAASAAAAAPDVAVSDTNVQDEPFEELPPGPPRRALHAVPAMPPPPLPPPAAPPSVDAEMMEAIRALPGQIAMAIQQSLPRVIPMPPAPAMPLSPPPPVAGPPPSFGYGQRWPYNGGR